MNITGKVIGADYVESCLDVLTDDNQLIKVTIAHRSIQFFRFMENKRVNITGFWKWKHIKLLDEVK